MDRKTKIQLIAIALGSALIPNAPTSAELLPNLSDITGPSIQQMIPLIIAPDVGSTQNLEQINDFSQTLQEKYLKCAESMSAATPAVRTFGLGEAPDDGQCMTGACADYEATKTEVINYLNTASGLTLEQQEQLQQLLGQRSW